MSYEDSLEYVTNGNYSKFKSNSSISNRSISCSKLAPYEEFEVYYHLYIMCPIALIGILLNVISLRVFNAKSFSTTVTFKYLRIIASTDLCICIIVFLYCVLMFTPAFNYYDLYIRHIYLAYIYIPLANLIINLSVFFNLLVSIERLISVGWPTKKYTYFKPSRYIISCVIVFIISITSNLILFFIYNVDFCKGLEQRNSFFTFELFIHYYNIVKEMLTRVTPIIMMIVSNIMLICIVKSSRNRMKQKKSTDTDLKPNRCSFRSIIDIFKKRNPSNNTQPKFQNNECNKNLIKNHSNKRNRQDNQLTLMTICVAIFYITCSVPMCFLIIIGSQSDLGSLYKHFAGICNTLELFQCSVRFFIYYFFTTQFRVEFKKNFSFLFGEKPAIVTEDRGMNIVVKESDKTVASSI